MRRIRFTILGLATVALAACQQELTRRFSSQDEADIKAAFLAFAAAASAGDVEAMTSQYTADAMVQPPNMPRARGTEEIRQLWTGLTAQVNTRVTFHVIGVAGEGSLAYAVGSYNLVTTMKDSTLAAPPPDNGKFLNAYRRQTDGSWKIVAGTWNTDRPMPAPAAAARRAAQPR